MGRLRTKLATKCHLELVGLQGSFLHWAGLVIRNCLGSFLEIEIPGDSDSTSVGVSGGEAKFWMSNC